MIWYVAFFPKKPEHWWAREFGHASLAGFDNQTWLHLDLRKDKTDIRLMFTKADTEDYLSFLLTHSTLLKFGPSIEAMKFKSYFRPMTCVGFICHTLGVSSRALRPDGLFRDLVRNYSAEIVSAAEKDT